MATFLFQLKYQSELQGHAQKGYPNGGSEPGVVPLIPDESRKNDKDPFLGSPQARHKLSYESTTAPQAIVRSHRTIVKLT